MSKSSGLLVDWSLQIELSDDVAWSEVEVILDDADQVLISTTILDSAVGVNMDGQWVGETDGVRDLHEDSVGQFVGNERLGDVSTVVGGRSVDLGLVFSGESTATVRAPASIGVDDDLSARESGISSWTADIELARWVDHDLSVLKHLRWNNLLNDLLSENLSDSLIVDIRRVLSRNEDVVDAFWLDLAVSELLVLDNDLGLAVGSQPWDLAVLPLDGHHFAELVSQNVRIRMQSLGVPLVSGISEHESLIASSHIQFVLSLMNRGGNVSILGMDINDNLTVVAVQTNIVRGESDLLADSTGHLLEVDLGFVD